jgi:hypothetical protein
MKQLIYTAVLVAAGAAACGAEEGAFGALRASLPGSAGIAAAPAPGPADRSLNSAQLSELLRDANPEIRKAAVKSARNHMLNSYASEPVLRLFADRSERADVRVEAARTLSYAAGYVRVQDALTALLRGPGEPRELRIMTYKALYNAAAGSSRVQDFLIASVRQTEAGRDARRAAVWALFASAENTRPQELLLGIVTGNEEESTRVEAVKSLYGAAGYPRVKRLFVELVSDGFERKPVRLAALKALSSTQDSSVQRFIAELSRSERDPELRAAAVAAAEPDQADLRDYFHLGYTLQSGGYVSPIEKE